MKEDLIKAYKKTFNKFKACEEVGVDVKEWDRLIEEDEEFVEMIRQAHEERAEQIKSELILKQDKTTAEIKLALELLASTSGGLKPKKKTPGKHSKSLGEKEKADWIKSRMDLIANE